MVNDLTQNVSKQLTGGAEIIKTGLRGITQFIRTSPVLSGAALGGSVLTGIAITQTVKRRKKRASTKKRKKKAITRKRKKRTTKKRKKKSTRKIVTGKQQSQ